MILSLGVGAAASATSAKVQAKAASGGTVSFAEPPGAQPNFIFPFMPFQYFSVDNISQFQYLMFRPLYWFGNGSQPTLNTSLSLANEPTFSNGDKTATVTLKNYKWSNGESVTAKDVVFWMNIMKLEKLTWAGYVPGTIPDDVSSITTPNSTTIVFNLTGPVNAYWWTYNELSQITPLPMAWDVTGPGQKAGSSVCANTAFGAVAASEVKGSMVPENAAAKNCVAVFTYLSTQSGYNPANPKASNNTYSTYATNPLWQVVDGPWHLTSYNATGFVEMKPNPSYSGPVKAKISVFEELPFTSNTAEFNALVGGKITVGFLPATDVTSPAISPTQPGKNNARVASNFNLVDWNDWGIDYFPENFNSTDDGGQAGHIISQLYFRQAFQELIDQPLFIKKLLKGYGVPTYGPVPVIPKNSFETKLELKNPYPYNPTKAVGLLKSNGWTINVGGTDVCNNASKCGVPVGTKLAFTLQYASGNATLAEQIAAMDAAWSAAGIKVTTSTATFDTILGNAIPCKGASCTWDFEDWGGGWVYSPDYYPTGEDLFETGAASNPGSYSNPTMDTLIKATDFGNVTLSKWEDFTTNALPFVWEPGPTYALIEVQKNLQGVAPMSPLLDLNPEDWYFKG
jgi:peptide/nickel transport system substrate-binding protein